MQRAKVDPVRTFAQGDRVRLPSGALATVSGYVGDRVKCSYDQRPAWQPPGFRLESGKCLSLDKATEVVLAEELLRRAR